MNTDENFGRIIGTVRDYNCKLITYKEAFQIIKEIIEPAEIIEVVGGKRIKDISKNKKRED